MIELLREAGQGVGRQETEGATWSPPPPGREEVKACWDGETGHRKVQY